MLNLIAKVHAASDKFLTENYNMIAIGGIVLCVVVMVIGAKY